MKPADCSFKKSEWEVRPVSVAVARELVFKYHYSKGGSNTAVYAHGLFRVGIDTPMGVAWWLPPTRVACESVNKEQWKKVLSLTRLVVLPEVPTNGASFLMGKSIEMIRRDGRFVSLVTYADESQSHTGAIYRATNWQYIGRTGPYQRWITKDGQQVACKATVNRTVSQMEALGYLRDGKFYKHKFVMHLSLQKRIRRETGDPLLALLGAGETLKPA